MKYPQPNLLVDSKHKIIPSELPREAFFLLLRLLVGEEAVARWDRDVADKIQDDVLVSVHDGDSLDDPRFRHLSSVLGHLRVYLSKSAAAWIAEEHHWVFTRKNADREGSPGAGELADALVEDAR